MKLVLNDTAKEWGSEPRHVEEYIETLRRRAMNVHRVVQQNCTLVLERRQSEEGQLGPRLALDGQGEGARKAEGSDAATKQ